MNHVWSPSSSFWERAELAISWNIKRNSETIFLIPFYISSTAGTGFACASAWKQFIGSSCHCTHSRQYFRSSSLQWPSAPTAVVATSSAGALAGISASARAFPVDLSRRTNRMHASVHARTSPETQDLTRWNFEQSEMVSNLWILPPHP